MKNGPMSSERLLVSLNCEHCGGSNLHQEQVEIYRGESPEDSPILQRTVCDRLGNVHTDKVPRVNSRNPSPRRDGVRMVFSCEQCGGFTNLLIAQRKGVEYLQTCRDGERLST